MPGGTGVRETGVHVSVRTLAAAVVVGRGGVRVGVGRRGASQPTFGVVAAARSASRLNTDSGFRRMRPSRGAGVEALADAGPGDEALDDAGAGAEALDDAAALASATASNSLCGIGPGSLQFS